MEARSALFKLARAIIVLVMSALATSLLLMSSAAAAQATVPAPATPWQPANAYVTVGQDEPGYRNWYLAAPWHASYVKAFNDYLVTYGVGGIVPTWQLLRTASQWQKCGAPAFEVPPTSEWPNIVATLRYIGSYVVPRIGPVEAVSVYRNPSLNVCAGGAAQSTHRFMGAVDLVPLRPVTRESLMEQLCAIHQESGRSHSVGLGFYKGLRFHVDARKYRDWGTQARRGGYGCAAVVAQGAAPFINAEVPAPPPAPAPAPTPLAPAASTERGGHRR